MTKRLQTLSEEAQQLDAERAFQDHTLHARVKEVVKTHAPKPKPYVFIFVDAGSSGTRPKLFFIADGPTATEIAEAAEMSPLTSIDPSRDGQPASADTFLTNMRTALKALYNDTHHFWALKNAPPAAVLYMSTKPKDSIDALDIYIQSTAGMRTIPQATARNIYQKLNADAHVKADTVSGRWEGFYGLYNAVTKTPTLFPNGWTMDNIVYVEIGGASIQVAFTVPLTRYADVQNVHLEITSQIENEDQHPILLEVEGPMHLRSLPGLPFERIYSQSFLGDAGDRIHARAIAKCVANNANYDAHTKVYSCPCLAVNAKLVDLANGAHDFTLAPADNSKAAKGRSSEGSRVCFATAVTRQFRQNSCKDYNIAPNSALVLAADQSIIGTSNYAQCLATVKAIHDNDDDEMPAPSRFSVQWAHLLNALKAAHAQDKTKVIINSGGLTFSSRMNGCVGNVVNWATLQNCFAAANNFDGAPVGDRSFGLPSVHALGEDILKRLELEQNNHEFKVINSGWLPAAAKITATALDLDDGDAKRLYSGADAFNAGPEDAPLDDHDWGTFWNGIHAAAGWIRSWFA